MPKTKKRKVAARKDAYPPIPKRQRNHKTSKDPWEASVDDAELEVSHITGKVTAAIFSSR